MARARRAARRGRHVAAAGRARRPRGHRSHRRGQRWDLPRPRAAAGAADAARPPLRLREGAPGPAARRARGRRPRDRERNRERLRERRLRARPLGRAPGPVRLGRAAGQPDGRARCRGLRVGRAAHRGGGAEAVGAGAAAAGEPRGVPGAGAGLGAGDGAGALPALAPPHPGLGAVPVPSFWLLHRRHSQAILQRPAGHGVPQAVGLAGAEARRGGAGPGHGIRGDPLGHAVPVPDVLPGLRLRPALQRRQRPQPHGARLTGRGASRDSRGPRARPGSQLRIPHGDPAPPRLRRERLRLPADVQRQPPDGVPALLPQLDGVQRNARVPGEAALGGAEGQEDGVGAAGLPEPGQGPRALRGPPAPGVRLRNTGKTAGKHLEIRGKTAGKWWEKPWKMAGNHKENGGKTEGKWREKSWKTLGMDGEIPAINWEKTLGVVPEALEINWEKNLRIVLKILGINLGIVLKPLGIKWEK